jgi:hypothetical protein
MNEPEEPSQPSRPRHFAVIGDVHGHLQLALCVAARWQAELGVRFEAVYLCGDVGTFAREDQLDGATRSHARHNPCELEFLTQWACDPPAPWLPAIFEPTSAGGLGLDCPVVMVHGNHEGFEHLAALPVGGEPREPADVSDLPTVDRLGRIRFLPSGRRIRGPGGIVVAGVGGIEWGQRRVRYHDMAYLDAEAIRRLRRRGPVDVLLTHQGPAAVQGGHGSPQLDALLDAAGPPRLWFHGHSLPEPNITDIRGTRVVPLADIAFGSAANAPPGPGGWAVVTVNGGELEIVREDPPFLREFRRNHWKPLRDGRLVAPPLHSAAWEAGFR